MLAWELIGAVVGAGLASGREIASFFSQYGGWGFAGILTSVLVMLCLSQVEIPASRQWRWFRRLWQLLLTLLLVSTGGAMLSGAGKVAALNISVRGAYWLGWGATFLLAWFLAHRTVRGLAWASRILLCVLMLLILSGFTIPPERAVAVSSKASPLFLLKGVTYGGFNAALQSPILSLSAGRTRQKRTQAVISSALAVGILLSLGCAVLLRHPALIGETMPFLKLTARLGRVGYLLASVALYMAILSTLTACMRGLQQWPLAIWGIAAASLFGFAGMVETVYPVLGCCCFAMLLWAKLMNCITRPFHSRTNMI